MEIVDRLHRCRNDVRTDHDGSGHVHWIIEDRHPEDPDLDAADSFDNPWVHPVCQGRVPAHIQICGEEGNLAVRKGGGKAIGQRIRAKIKFMVTDRHRIKSQRPHEVEFRDIEKLVEEQISVGNIARMEKKDIGFGRSDLVDDGGSACDPAEFALHMNILRPE